jgi:hypothetical protein
VTLTFNSALISSLGNYTILDGTSTHISEVESFLLVCTSSPTASTAFTTGTGAADTSAFGCAPLVNNNRDKALRNLTLLSGASGTEISASSIQISTNYWKDDGSAAVPINLVGTYLALATSVKGHNNSYFWMHSEGMLWGGNQSVNNSNNQVVVVTPNRPVVPVFKQPKFAMPSKIDVDTTGKVSLSGKDMGVSTVLIGGKEQKIDTNSDEKLVFDTTGLAKGVHDLVMKGAFGTYTIQKAIQVGEAVVTKVAAVSARQVGMAGGELSISGQGLEGTTQITMNGQVLEIVSRTDSKVTFKVPASTVASVNSIMIEGSFVPVIFKNAFSYTK